MFSILFADVFSNECIFHLFPQNDPEDESGYPAVRHGKLSLVDLAGKIIVIKGDQETMNLVRKVTHIA